MQAAKGKTTVTDDQAAFLRESEWFGGVEPAFQQSILKSSYVKALAAGTAVFRRGDQSDGMYCVLSGVIRFGVFTPHGKESILALAVAPEWFGEIAVFDGGPRTHDAWADTASTLLHLPQRFLAKCLRDDPGRWQQLGKLLVRKLRVSFSLLEDMAIEPPRVRLARCLMNLINNYGQRKQAPSTEIRISQERLGTMVALSRQTVNELLRQLEHDSIVQCRRRGVRILDLGRLRVEGRGA